MPTLFQAVRKITPTFIVFILVSCSGNEKTTTVIKAMEESLINSSQTINRSSAQVLNTLENKIYDPASRERAMVWFPKAELVSKLSRDMYDSLEKMKALKKITREKAGSLYNDLINYKDKIFATDPSIRETFSDNLIFTTRSFDTLRSKGNEFFHSFFQNSSFVPGFLTQIQNNIKVIENKLITYCNDKCGAIIDFFDVYTAIISQSSTVLKAGEKLTIQAGMGAFSKATSPKIRINGIPVPLIDSGYASVRLRVKTIPGQYSIPVEIYYRDQYSGKEEKIIYSVKYTVAKECDQ